MPEVDLGPEKDLDAWLSYIDQQHSASIDMGLERFTRVLKDLNLQQPAPVVITVAGTNGKGSTVRVMESLLLQAGKRVGATLSPHIWHFNERIRINGADASDQDICAAFAAIDDCRGEMPLTYFEFGALAALYCMAAAKVEVAILEIGLGGRLDAFNAVDADVAVITSIGLDHQAFLGDTREAIGFEKAGILRPNQRVVLGQDMPVTVDRQCQALGVKPLRWGESFTSSDFGDGQHWLYQRAGAVPVTVELSQIAPHNIALACEAVAPWVAIDSQSVHGCSGQQMPGRMDIRQRDQRVWVHDVCHNPHGAEFFMAELARRHITPAFFICAMLAGKDHKGFFDAVNAAIETPVPWLCVSSTGDRAITGSELAQHMGLPERVAQDMTQAQQMAVEHTDAGQTIVVFGSFSAVEQCPWLA